MTKIPVWRVDNIYPIAISFITMALTVSALYWGLSNKIDLLTQRMDFYIEKTQTNYGSLQSLQRLYTKLEFGVAKCCPQYIQ